jgi:predicted enzyme related to lactoylglutathione lyase
MTIVPWIHAFVDVPADRLAETTTFWSATTGWPSGSPWPRHPEFVSLQPPGAGSYLHVQRIGGPPRVHLDLLADDIDAEAQRLAALGARRHDRHEWWQVMESPGGLPFCLCGDPDRVRPGPARWPDGHRSRVVQVCVDIPAAAYDAELAFWHHATGWPPGSVDRPEYDRLEPPAGSPLRMITQRLGTDDAGKATRVHVDIGTDDLDAEVARVQALGARLVERFDRWVVFEDPAGLPFCVTPKPPD